MNPSCFQFNIRKPVTESSCHHYLGVCYFRRILLTPPLPGAVRMVVPSFECIVRVFWHSARPWQGRGMRASVGVLRYCYMCRARCSSAIPKSWCRGVPFQCIWLAGARAPAGYVACRPEESISCGIGRSQCGDDEPFLWSLRKMRCRYEGSCCLAGR